LLIRLREGFTYTTRLRCFLAKHPLLVIELGFHLHLDPTQAYGFDVEHTLRSDFWLRQKLGSRTHLVMRFMPSSEKASGSCITL